jgi:hypothetical protein
MQLNTINDFCVEVLERYDEIVWKIHQQNLMNGKGYDTNTHYPLILKIYWKEKN